VSQSNTVSRIGVDRVPLLASARDSNRAFVGDLMAAARQMDVGSHDRNLTQSRRDLFQSLNPLGLVTVIVRQQKSHVSTSPSHKSESSTGNFRQRTLAEMPTVPTTL
jgi:hypothetical protein